MRNNLRSSPDGTFKLIRNTVIMIIIFSFLTIIGTWFIMGYVAYKVASDPSGFATTIGELTEDMVGPTIDRINKSEE